MKKLLNFLTSKIKFILLLYFLVQAILIFSIQTDYKSDALYYYNLAQECIEVNEFYPASQHLFEDYIVAPLYINALVIILNIHNSSITISFFNLVVILLQVLLLFKIITKIFTENIAKVSILLYILYMNSFGLMLQNYTELFFLLMITVSLYFFLFNKISSLILSGLFLGGAIAVRPLGWALLLALLLIHIYKSIKNRKILFYYFHVYSGTIIFVLLFGGFTFLHFGQFEFTSTTGPVNILIGANDDATGAFNSTVFEKGKAGYIEYPDSLTYLEKDDFYRQQSLNWITANPVRWILLTPMKLFHTFAWDDISLSSIFRVSETNFARVMKIILLEFDYNKALPDTTTTAKVLYLSILIMHHLFYYFLLFAMLAGVYEYLKNRKYNENINLILLFCAVAILMIMITVGAPRYKYPMFILLLPIAANYLTTKFLLAKQLNE